jgi:hypothetical protein
VQDIISPLAKLEAALADTSDVYVNAGTDTPSYFARLTDSIRKHVCEPFLMLLLAAPFPATVLHMRLAIGLSTSLCKTDFVALGARPEQSWRS